MNKNRKTAMRFIVLMGFVSLFGDITYEGARSVTGPYMAFLGAGAFAVGLVAGLGEFLGYALRLVSGFVADRTRAYWPLTILGYGLIFAIPFLGFAGNWPLAALFIVLERAGKAIRSPARDAILSYATKEVGRGWGFGIHEAMDQVGAIAGPLIFSFVLLSKGGYSQGFRILFIPAFLTLIFLFIAKRRVSSPEEMEENISVPDEPGKDRTRFPGVFWLYVLFTFFCVAGFANFQVISYHFKAKSVVPDIQIPLFYCLAMAVDGVVALIIGKTYDKIGLKALLFLPLLTIPIPFLGFSQNYAFVFASVVLWGAAMGIHETIMRAAIADLTPINKRGIAYGIFNTAYGLAWFIGSALMGFLYDKSLVAIFVFVVVVEIASLPVFFALRKTSLRS
jgi:MFS family permease